MTLLALPLWAGCGGAGGPRHEGEAADAVTTLALAGRVLYVDGAPAAGLSVTASREQPGGRRTSYGRTDESGAFTVMPLDAGSWQVRVGFASDVVLETNVALTAGPSELTLRIPRGRISGQVRDSTQRPLAQVGVLVTGPGDSVRHQRTDDAGEFRVAGLADGVYTVAAELGPWGAMVRRHVTIRDGRAAEQVLLMPGSWRMCGRIMDHEGDAMAGAAVVARPLDGELRASGVRGQAVSDADGRFCVSNLYAGVYEVAVDAGERGRLRLDRVALDAHRDDLSLVLGGGGELLGHVAFPGGAPATGVLVQAVLPDGGEVFSSRSLTDASGRFRLPRLRPGSYRLFARGAEGLSPWASVEVVPSARPADYELKLTGAGSTLEGVVTREGRPVEKATVLLEHRWGLDLPVMHATDAQGRYAFTGLPGGSYVLRAVVDGQWQEREVPVGDEAVVKTDLAVDEAGGGAP